MKYGKDYGVNLNRVAMKVDQMDFMDKLDVGPRGGRLASPKVRNTFYGFYPRRWLASSPLRWATDISSLRDSEQGLDWDLMCDLAVPQYATRNKA
jgi:hypothetical protein